MSIAICKGLSIDLLEMYKSICVLPIREWLRMQCKNTIPKYIATQEEKRTNVNLL